MEILKRVMGSNIRKLWIGLLVLALLLPAISSVAEGLLLPRGAKAGWVWKVEDASKTLPAAGRFGVDRSGRVWVIANEHLLMAPTEGLLFHMQEAVRDVMGSTEGSLLLTTDRAVGGLVMIERKGSALHSGLLDEIMLLPGKNFRLAQGGSKGSLVWGRESKKGPWTVLRLGKKGKRDKLFEWKASEVTAVLARGKSLYVALGGKVVRISARGRKIKKVLEHDSVITEMTWVEGAGLVYVSGQRLFLMKGFFKSLPMMDCNRCLPRGHGKDLYVLVRQPGGVLKITGLEKLKKVFKKK